MRGSEFGVGTYIKELIKAMRGADVVIHNIILSTKVSEFKIEILGDIKHIYIPLPERKNQDMDNTTYMDVLFSNSVYVLKTYIDETQKTIFHINFLQSANLSIN